ncbi:hypothetical protein ACET3Z_009313 [Daucus carota]
MVSKVIPRREEKCPCPLLSNVVSYDLQVMKEMSEVDSEDSVDESDPEANEFEDPNVGDFLIGLKGSRLRYQDIHHALAPNQRSHLVTKLRMYKEVVGEKLSKEMVLSLG